MPSGHYQKMPSILYWLVFNDCKGCLVKLGIFVLGISIACLLLLSGCITQSTGPTGNVVGSMPNCQPDCESSVDGVDCSLPGTAFCQAGNCWNHTCMLTFAACEDNNPCTIDASAGVGCNHPPKADGLSCRVESSLGVCSSGNCNLFTTAAVQVTPSALANGNISLSWSVNTGGRTVSNITVYKCANASSCTASTANGYPVTACASSQSSGTCLDDGTFRGGSFTGPLSPGTVYYYGVKAELSGGIIKYGAAQATTQGSSCLTTCNDSNPCTTDSCVSANCVFTNLPSTTSCTAGSPPVAGHCNSGTCTPTVSCGNYNDNNPCTTDSCNSTTGAVTHTPVANGTACTSGSSAGICTAGVCSILCSDTDAGLCGGKYPAPNQGVTCDAGDNAFDRGTVTQAGNSLTGSADSCVGGLLTEYYCDTTSGNIAVYPGFDCSSLNTANTAYSCVTGACVGAPAAPSVTLQASAASASQINLSWTINRAGKTVKDFNMVMCGNGICSTLLPINSCSWFNNANPPLSCIRVQLSPNMTYTHKVTVTFTDLTTVTGSASATTGTTSVPSVTLQAVPGPRSMTLNWVINRAGKTVRDFKVERCGSSCSFLAPIHDCIFSNNASPPLTCVDSPLAPDTYSYKASATFTDGTNVSSSIVSATALPDTSGGSVSLTAQSSSPTQINLSWAISNPPYMSLTSYGLYRCPSSVQCTSNGTSLPHGANTSSTTYSDTERTANTDYYYYLTAAFSDGSSVTGTANATTASPVECTCSGKACGADDGCGNTCLIGTCPQSLYVCQAGICTPPEMATVVLRAAPVSPTTINLSWIIDQGEIGGSWTSLYLYRCPSSVPCATGGTEIFSTRSRGQSFYSDTGLTPETTYNYYATVSFNRGSSTTGAASATTQAGCHSGADCDDSNPCTANSCDVPTGRCSNPAQAGTCTVAGGVSGTCSNGTCIPSCSSDAACNDSSPCTTDTCVRSVCSHAPANLGISCGPSGSTTECKADGTCGCADLETDDYGAGSNSLSLDCGSGCYINEGLAEGGEIGDTVCGGLKENISYARISPSRFYIDSSDKSDCRAARLCQACNDPNNCDCTTTGSTGCHATSTFCYTTVADLPNCATCDARSAVANCHVAFAANLSYPQQSFTVNFNHEAGAGLCSRNVLRAICMPKCTPQTNKCTADGHYVMCTDNGVWGNVPLACPVSASGQSQACVTLSGGVAQCMPSAGLISDFGSSVSNALNSLWDSITSPFK